MISYLVLDVDGTMTDGKIYLSSAGEEVKAFDVKDGYAIKHYLLAYSITPVIITGRKSAIVSRRAEELGIKYVYQGVEDKASKLEDFLDSRYCSLKRVAYMGDDLNDLPCMASVKEAGGIVGCPADAAEAVLAISDFVSSKHGGDGAVREFIEWLCDRERE